MSVKNKIHLMSIEDLFTTQAERDDAKLERVQEVPVAELHPFPQHPFVLRDDEEMACMVESISQMGVISPGLARPREGGGYELVSGHRRLAACERLGLTTMPVIVREMTDEEAVVAMVDANLQREHILPSEKAVAYKMKLEALNRQGYRSDHTFSPLEKRFNTYEELAKESGDSRNQIHRYIRLTHLVPPLLAMVDEGKMALRPAVELSYLTEEEQTRLLSCMEQFDCTPSHSQAISLKKLSQLGALTQEDLEQILSKPKANQQEQLHLPMTELKKFFPATYSDTQMKQDILKGLELLKRQRERNRRER